MTELIFSGRCFKQFRFIAFVILLSSCTIIVHAQINFLKKIDEVGVTVGPGMVWFKGNEIYQDGQLFKPIQNIGFRIKWFARNPRLGMDVNILLEELGNENFNAHSKFDPDLGINLIVSNTATWDLNYLTVPVSFHYHFFKKMRFYTSVGVFGGYFMKGKLTVEEFDGIDKKTFIYYDFSQDLKNYNFGGTTGVGYQVLVKKNFSLAIELTRRFGFLDLNNHNYNKLGAPVRTQAMALTVLLSTSIKSGKSTDVLR